MMASWCREAARPQLVALLLLHGDRLAKEPWRSAGVALIVLDHGQHVQLGGAAPPIAQSLQHVD